MQDHSHDHIGHQAYDTCQEDNVVNSCRWFLGRKSYQVQVASAHAPLISKDGIRRPSQYEKGSRSRGITHRKDELDMARRHKKAGTKGSEVAGEADSLAG